MVNPSPRSLFWRFLAVWRLWCWCEASTRLEASGLGRFLFHLIFCLFTSPGPVPASGSRTGSPVAGTGHLAMPCASTRPVLGSGSRSGRGAPSHAPYQVLAGGMFFGMKMAGVLRISEEVETLGMDLSKHGGSAYEYGGMERALASLTRAPLEHPKSPIVLLLYTLFLPGGPEGFDASGPPGKKRV